jgi:signal transduction histidine kinase
VKHGTAARASDATVTRALLVEDNPGDARLVRELLRQSGERIDIEHVTTVAGALPKLAAGAADIVLLDLVLPDVQGLETVSRVRDAGPDVPVIVLTGFSDATLAVQAVRSGAQDYLVKGRMDCDALVRGIRYAMERQRMLRELEQTRREQLHLKDQLLSHVSHELRTPLNAIYGFVTLVLDGLGGEVTPAQREYLTITLKNVAQLGAMISDLLDATRAEAGKLVVALGRVAIDEVVRDTAQTLAPVAAEKGLAVAVELPADLPAVRADAHRVQQILTNLVDNAVKFTPAGGRVTLAARAEPAFGCVRVSVADTGCGIEPGAGERIFERLHQERAPAGGNRTGLGLGLYLCKALAERQGGRIWVESTVGRGSTFHLTLPMVRPGATA